MILRLAISLTIYRSTVIKWSELWHKRWGLAVIYCSRRTDCSWSRWSIKQVARVWRWIRIIANIVRLHHYWNSGHRQSVANALFECSISAVDRDWVTLKSFRTAFFDVTSFFYEFLIGWMTIVLSKIAVEVPPLFLVGYLLITIIIIAFASVVSGMMR